MINKQTKSNSCGITKKLLSRKLAPVRVRWNHYFDIFRMIPLGVPVRVMSVMALVIVLWTVVVLPVVFTGTAVCVGPFYLLTKEGKH